MSSPSAPTKIGLSRTTGHLLSILIIGIVTICVIAIAEYTKDGGFWMWVGFLGAVAAMSWHAFVLGISATGINIKQNGSTIQ